MKRFAAALVLAAAFAPAAQAEILDLNVGDNAFRASLAGPLSRLFTGTNGQYDLGILIKPKTSEDLLQLHTGVLLTGDAGARNVDVAAGLGVRAVYTGIDNDSGGALALGGQVEGRVPSFNRFGLTGYAYYAPSMLSLGNVDGYMEYGVALDYELIRGGSVYVGYRNIEEDFVVGNTEFTLEVDEGAHIGFRLKF